MTTPLGFRRSTRKRLKRCEHPPERVNAMRLPDGGFVVTCVLCGQRNAVTHDEMVSRYEANPTGQIRELLSSFKSRWFAEPIAMRTDWASDGYIGRR